MECTFIHIHNLKTNIKSFKILNLSVFVQVSAHTLSQLLIQEIASLSQYFKTGFGTRAYTFVKLAIQN